MKRVCSWRQRVTEAGYVNWFVGHTGMAFIKVGLDMYGSMTSPTFSESELCHIPTRTPTYGESVSVTCHQGRPAQARYVWVYLPLHNQSLGLCEVEVYESRGTHPSLKWNVLSIKATDTPASANRHPDKIYFPKAIFYSRQKCGWK